MGSYRVPSMRLFEEKVNALFSMFSKKLGSDETAYATYEDGDGNNINDTYMKKRDA